MRFLITGGAGFIGTALCRHLLAHTSAEVIVFDKLTYASNRAAVSELCVHPRYDFIQADICNFQKVDTVLKARKPTAVLHLAAESHVDRSIRTPADFVETNVKGTMVLLEAARKYLHSLAPEQAEAFRFLHVSTDEVFGDLGEAGHFREHTPYNPSSPYAASKAASDHMVRAWVRTYGFPAIITNCTNNYGQEQYPEKLIPLICRNAFLGQPLPVYGDGSQVRDWIHVDDHVRALLAVLEKGTPGETYAIGARNECRNIELVETICRAFDRLLPRATPYESLIRFVADRPGHDKRYAIDPTKLEREIGWRPQIDFQDGIEKTALWYLTHSDWQSTAPAPAIIPQRASA